jgi:hypothetical protein
MYHVHSVHIFCMCTDIKRLRLADGSEKNEQIHLADVIKSVFLSRMSAVSCLFACCPFQIERKSASLQEDLRDVENTWHVTNM